MNCEKARSFLSKYGDLALRIVVGVIFIISGYGKLFGMPGIEGFSGMLAGLGFPIPTFFSVLVGVVELLGGIFLVLGLWADISASLLAFVMLVAVLSVHLKNGWMDVRYPLVLLLVLVRYIGVKSDCLGVALGFRKAKKSKKAKK